MFIIDVLFQGKHWCQIELEAKTQNLEIIRTRFPKSDGFQLRSYQVKDTKRIIEYSSKGMKLLAQEHKLEPLSDSTYQS